jgi:hypothetical protein
MRQPANPLTPAETRARVAALRAISRARQFSFDAARDAFAEALRLDPALKLASIPDFWSLPKEAHQAAIDAYESEGREHDAAMLMAMRRRMFRPRLMPE